MCDFHINLLSCNVKNTGNFRDTMFSYSYLPSINIFTIVTIRSRTLIGNIIYHKSMLNITTGNLSSVTSDHLIQLLIEPSSTKTKLEEICKLQRCYNNFDKNKHRMICTKSAGKDTSVI